MFHDIFCNKTRPVMTADPPRVMGMTEIQSTYYLVLMLTGRDTERKEQWKSHASYFLAWMM